MLYYLCCYQNFFSDIKLEEKNGKVFKELERSDIMLSILALKLKQISAKYPMIVKEENSYYSDILI